jgi:chromosome segregation ATPase
MFWLQLQHEADQRVHLERSLASLQQDLNNERTQRQNIELALATANNSIKEQERASQEQLAHIHRLSTQEDNFRAGQTSLQQENKRLLRRVEELEVNNQQLGRSVNAPRSHAATDDDRAAYLQHQLEELQESHRRQTAELRSTAERLQRAQGQLTQSQNEGLATEKKLRMDVQRLEEAIEEREEELGYLRNQAGGDSSREQQLLSRIEEEEARVQALEFTVRQQTEELKSKGNADRLIRAAERRADAETRKAEDLNNQLSRLRDDLQSAEDRAGRDSHIASELSAQLSELERAHREVIQEKTYVSHRNVV